MGIGFRHRTVKLKQGEMFAVAKEMKHITRANEECHALLVEPRGTVNAGATGGLLAAENDCWI